MMDFFRYPKNSFAFFINSDKKPILAKINFCSIINCRDMDLQKSNRTHAFRKLFPTDLFCQKLQFSRSQIKYSLKKINNRSDVKRVWRIGLFALLERRLRLLVRLEPQQHDQHLPLDRRRLHLLRRCHYGQWKRRTRSAGAVAAPTFLDQEKNGRRVQAEATAAVDLEPAAAEHRSSSSSSSSSSQSALQSQLGHIHRARHTTWWRLQARPKLNCVECVHKQRHQLLELLLFGPSAAAAAAVIF